MNNKRILSVLSLIFCLLLLSVIALSCAAMLKDYEADTHYFVSGAILPTIAVIASVVTGIFGIVLTFLMPTWCLATDPFGAARFTALPATIACLSSGIGLLFFTDGTGIGLLAKIAAVLLLFFGIYCFLVSSPRLREIKNGVAFLGFSAVIGCALLNAYYYFDTSLEMNAPVKVMLQSALLFSMLYFTAEIRFLLSRGHARLYLILSSCTVAACALCAVSVPVAYTFGILVRSSELFGAILSLGIGLTVLFRAAHLTASAR